MAPKERPDGEFTERATHYFSEDQLHQMDVIALKLKTEYGPELRKVGKSEVMRAMFDTMAEDFFLKGHKSMLAERLRRGK